MTDQTIPAGLTRDEARAVREWAERSYAAEVQDETMYHAARVLLAVLPKSPTLADMTDEERRACRWMLCDVKNVKDRAIIVDPCREDGTARVVWPGALNEPPIDWEKVTPRPDVACMTWPGDQEADQ